MRYNRQVGHKVLAGDAALWSRLDGGRTRVSRQSFFFEAHGLPYHFGIDFLPRSLHVLCSGLVGDTRIIILPLF